MAELRGGTRPIWQVVEQARGGGQRVHGTFDTQAEADVRFAEVARADPIAYSSMALAVVPRTAEVFEPVGELSPRGDSSGPPRR